MVVVVAAMRQTIENLARNFREMPFHSLLPHGLLAPIFSGVRLAWMKCSALEYANFSVFCAILLFLLSLLFFSPLQLGAALLISLAISLFSLLLLLKYPYFLARERTRELERDLATGLKTIHLCLAGGSSFESSLEAASVGHGAFSQEVSKMLREIRSGTRAPTALRELAEFDSLLLKRVASQLVFEYEHGGKGEGLSAIADEALARQHSLAKEHSGRLAFLTVVFIAVSAVVPALFSAYVIIAGSFLEIPFSPQQILVAFAIVFPLADALLLWYARASSPKLSVGR